MEKEKYYVDLHVPKFVQRYLTINFGCYGSKNNCYDIRTDKNLYLMFQTYLCKKVSSDANWRKNKKHFRTEHIRIEVTQKDFVTRGPVISAENENKFVHFLESRCRMMLLVYINSYKKVGLNLAEAIRVFYKVTGWSDNSWPSISIRKIVERAENRSDNGIFKHQSTILQEINEIILTTMSQNATLTKLGQNIYDYNSKQL